MRIGLYLGAAVLALAAPASAAWLQASSKHFVIYGDMPADEMRSYATRLEKFDAAARLIRSMKDPTVGDGNRVQVLVAGPPQRGAESRLHDRVELDRLGDSQRLFVGVGDPLIEVIA